MDSKIKIFLIVFMMIPLISCGQSKVKKIETESTFANEGDYNNLNNHLLFASIDINLVTKSINDVSIRIKDLTTGKESIIVSNLYLSSPAFGWIDSSHVFYETSESIGEPKAFGSWQGYLIKYNIYTQQKDTLPSSWYSSDNYVRNFYTSPGRLFYTVSYKGEEKGYWMVYFFDTGVSQVMKEQNQSTDFDILTYQYLPESDEIIYVKGNKSYTKYEFIRFSVSTGEEKTIKAISSDNSIMSSTIDSSNFYYLERITSENLEGVSDLKNSNYVINSIDINTGVIKQVHSFEKGIEVSKIDLYERGKLLVSIQGRIEENEVEKTFNLPEGGDITIGLNPVSYLYILEI